MRATAGSLAAVLAATACATGPAAGDAATVSTRAGRPVVRDRPSQAGPEIGLRRGGVWSTISMRPPYMVGPEVQFILRNGVLSGAVQGGTLYVRISEDGADGYGPAGSVALSFHEILDGLEVEGTWNGSRVHLEFGDHALRGAVVQGGSALILDPRREFNAPQFLGPPPDAGVAGYTTCHYALDVPSAEGMLEGVSTCGDMPEQTRLEVPRLARAYLTRPELIVVLVALLSAPPGVGRIDRS